MRHVLRTINRTIKPVRTSDGGGVKLLRSIGSGHIDHLDPFLLLDEFKSDKPDEYIAGFPDHPHRGFETVTYMLAGHMEHHDHKGNKGDLVAGSVQWMTAGRGIVHSEMPKQENGLMWGFQLWVNLPAKDKMCPPRYQDIPPEKIPEVVRPDNTKIRVIAGECDGVKGAVKGIVTQPTYLDVAMPKNTTFCHSIPPNHNAFAYVFEGKGYFKSGATESKEAEASTLVVYNQGGDQIEVVTKETPCRFLLVAAQPINEPIARYGPFVMNTKEELMQAFIDYEEGRLQQ